MQTCDRKNKIAIKNWKAAVLSAAVLLLSGITSVLSCKNIDLRQYDNASRLLTAEAIKEASAGNYEKGEYPYLICDLSGNVLYADQIFSKELGDTVNVQEILQVDKSFAKTQKGYGKESFVLEKDGVVTGFAIYLLPEDKTGKQETYHEMLRCLRPLLFGSVLSFSLLLARIAYCNRKMLTSIREIGTSAKGIIIGNYDGEVQRVYETKVADNEMGDLIYSFELMRDELKNKQVTEEALKRSQQEMISCISHDLKTPLSTIKAYAEGLRDNIAKDEAGRASYIRIIIEKTDLLIGMIQDLLQFSNAQLKQFEIHKREVYFNPYFKKVMKELETFVKHRQMGFQYQIPESDRIVCIDEIRITEVLYNLVENSMKYKKDGGWIKIAAKQEKDHIRVTVSDNGIGILSDDIPYVFDKFYRAEKSRSTSIPGSGLGLSICKHIIEEHGGEIYCRSRKGEGCEIGFTLY